MNIHVSQEAFSAEQLISAEDLDKLNARRTILGPDQCWPWHAGTGNSGYPHLWLTLDGKYTCHDAHKVSFAAHNGRMPKAQVLHRCNCKTCTNPAHLFEGSQSQNIIQALHDGLLVKKLTPADVFALLKERSEKHAIELCARAKIRTEHLQSIVSGRAWGHLTGRQPIKRVRSTSFQLAFSF